MVGKQEVIQGQAVPTAADDRIVRGPRDVLSGVNYFVSSRLGLSTGAKICGKRVSICGSAGTRARASSHKVSRKILRHGLSEPGRSMCCINDSFVQVQLLGVK